MANKKCILDVKAFAENSKLIGGTIYQMLFLLTFNKSYRSLFYYRIGWKKNLISWLAPGESTLHLVKTCKIKPGTVFLHSYGTILNGWEIGTGCRITCNITIGDKGGKRPVIGNNVEILPGAVVVGDVHVGDNCVIGPNCVVHKSIPDNSVVVGNPAIILKENGVIVRRPL